MKLPAGARGFFAFGDQLKAAPNNGASQVGVGFVALVGKLHALAPENLDGRVQGLVRQLAVVEGIPFPPAKADEVRRAVLSLDLVAGPAVIVRLVIQPPLSLDVGRGLRGRNRPNQVDGNTPALVKEFAGEVAVDATGVHTRAISRLDSRCAAASQNSSFASIPIAFRPIRSAVAKTLPDPMNGSSTVP